MSEPTSDPGQPPVTPEPAPGPVPPTYPSSYPEPTYPQPTYPQQPTYPAPPEYPAYAQPDYSQQAYAQPAYGYPAYAPPTSDRRPGTVTAAAVITWICTTLSLVGLLIILALVLSDNESFYDELTDEDFSRSDIRTFSVVFVSILAFWAVGAIVTAVFAFRRQNWARILLVISSVLSVPLLLLAGSAIVPVLFALLAITTVVLLFTGGANEWYRTGGAPTPPMPPAAPGPTYY